MKPRHDHSCATVGGICIQFAALAPCHLISRRHWQGWRALSSARFNQRAEAVQRREPSDPRDSSDLLVSALQAHDHCIHPPHSSQSP